MCPDRPREFHRLALGAIRVSVTREQSTRRTLLFPRPDDRLRNRKTTKGLACELAFSTDRRRDKPWALIVPARKPVPFYWFPETLIENGEATARGRVD